MDQARPGRHNALIDVPGIRVGHHTVIGDGYLTGTTVVLAPDGGMTAGVDIRGGGPATHETDLLAPTASVERIHALVLTGGSAFGLATCTGVMNDLARAGIGLPVGPAAGEVVPLVPGAALFDLGRGGDFTARPTLEFGSLALQAAQADGSESASGPPPAQAAGQQPGIDIDTRTRAGALQGSIGAGAGAVVSNLKGGIGTASVLLPGVGTVAALVALNAAGSPVDDRAGSLLGAHLLLPADGTPPEVPDEAARAALRTATAPRPPRTAFSAEAGTTGDTSPLGHTTLVVVATDATLSKAQCAKMAAVAQNGLARAVNPVHTMFDGDIVFGLATGSADQPDLLGFHQITVAAADVVTRSIVRAVLAGQHTTTAAGDWPAYVDVINSAGEAPGVDPDGMGTERAWRGP
ncbi:MAG: P1 family peptidase [Nakamurella sp.]